MMKGLLKNFRRDARLIYLPLFFKVNLVFKVILVLKRSTIEQQKQMVLMQLNWLVNHVSIQI